MANQLKLEVTESAQTLQQRLRQEKHPENIPKLQALWWYKTGQAETVQELARLAGRHRTNVSRWLSRYRQGGLERMLEIRRSPGRPRVIPSEVKERIAQELQDPQGFDSYQELQQWLRAQFGIEAAYPTVHQLVRYELKSKLKRARPRSRKQDPQAVPEFKKTSPA